MDFFFIEELEKEYLYLDESTILIALIDCMKYMDENNGVWYKTHNEKMANFTSKNLTSFIEVKLYKMTTDKADLYSARLVYNRLLDSYPTSSLYNALGSTYMTEDTSLAFSLFIKAIEMYKENYDAVINTAVSSLYLKDEEGFKSIDN